MPFQRRASKVCPGQVITDPLDSNERFRVRTVQTERRGMVVLSDGNRSHRLKADDFVVVVGWE